MLQYKRLESDGWTQFHDRQGSEVRLRTVECFNTVTLPVQVFENHQSERYYILRGLRDPRHTPLKCQSDERRTGVWVGPGVNCSCTVIGRQQQATTAAMNRRWQ